MLQFEVDDLDGAVQAALMMGASLDGPIKYPLHGKARCLGAIGIVHASVTPLASPLLQIATVRSPEGHMVALYEPSGDVSAADAAAFAKEMDKTRR